MKIDRNDDFGGALLNCAVRYALGRCSYMPNLVMDEIKPMLPDCNNKTIEVFIQDIGEWLDMNSPKNNNYYSEWKEFLELCYDELETRK